MSLLSPSYTGRTQQNSTFIAKISRRGLGGSMALAGVGGLKPPAGSAPDAEEQAQTFTQASKHSDVRKEPSTFFLKKTKE
jgi:hypothetical protein